MRSIIKLVFLTLLILYLFNFRFLMGKDIPYDRQDTGKSMESQSLLALHYSIFSYELIPKRKDFNPETFLLTFNDDNVSSKSPWLAFGLSLLYPGLGQLYNAEYGKALLMGGLGTLGLGLAMLAAMSTNYDSESNPDYIAVIGYTGVAIWGGTYLWSLIDAPISASNMNERNRKLGIQIFSNEDEKFTIGLRRGNKTNNYSLDFSVNF